MTNFKVWVENPNYFQLHKCLVSMIHVPGINGITLTNSIRTYKSMILFKRIQFKNVLATIHEYPESILCFQNIKEPIDLTPSMFILKNP